MIETKSILVSCLFFGLAVGIIHGLPTGILIGVFKLGEFKGALAGFLVVQVFILLWTILNFGEYFDFYRPTFSFENLIANLIVFIVGWLAASGFFLLQTTLTGYVTAKIVQIFIAKNTQID